MKKILQPLLLILIVFVAFQCCTSNTGRSRKPVSVVTLTPNSQNHVYGQALDINITTKVHDGELKEVKLFLNNELLTVSDKTIFTYRIEKLGYLGQNTLRIMAEKQDGNSNTRLQGFTVLSDLVPEKFNYEIIREHPHSTDHFTQGLEFANGFLYEGTGEHGKSGIFKTNHMSGKILMSKMLDEKFFGEGITIMNDKLYQLTYKSKVGFVYNLSDFAVIDSFRFDSKEGWGLTNDGTYLIMSDGTGTLTWLDPETFKTVKRIQVADNRRIWEYLNELEYVDGSIWANVWTTNQIVRIDAGTGKITGFLDLDGILSVMHQSQQERIDVLNGIAYNPQNGHFYVTGKLWPKLFEIKIN